MRISEDNTKMAKANQSAEKVLKIIEILSEQNDRSDCRIWRKNLI
jgi:hypothetical protein